jgi:hypothetical protein
MQVGHGDRLTRLRAILPARDGLVLAGGGHAGVGVPDCVSQGRAAADRVLSALFGEAASQRGALAADASAFGAGSEATASRFFPTPLG